MFEIARYLFRAWKYRLRNERHELEYLSTRVPTGGIAVDVGAHKGAYLFWLRKLVGAKGRVFAFEPQPALARYLQDIVLRMGWTNVTVENLGVSSSAGRLPLFVPSSRTGVSPGASLNPIAAARAQSTLDVEVVRLDDYFAARNIERIDVLKCDVEGHELEVFRGAAELLANSAPTILFECEGRHHSDGRIAPVLDYLHELGFDGKFFLRDGLHPLDEFLPERHQARCGERFWEADDYCNNFAFERQAG